MLILQQPVFYAANSHLLYVGKNVGRRIFYGKIGKINSFICRLIKLIELPQVLPAPQSGVGVATSSRGLLSEAMSSVVKTSVEVPPWALREVDRLRENPENG
jgi:hypothetical protein